MGAGRTAAALIRACHPEPTIAVTAICTAFAVAAGRGWGAVWVATAVLAGQLSVGWSNDYLDRGRDAASARPDKPVAAGTLDPALVRNLAVPALLAGAALSFASGPAAALAHIAGIVAAWLYNLRLKATVLSPLPYAIGFGGLAAFVVWGLPGHPAPPVWLVIAVALLGVGAHFANVIPDLQDDLRTGVRGLPHRLGATAGAVTAALILWGASVLLAVGPGAPGAAGSTAIAVAAVLAGAAVVSARRPGSRAPFRIGLLIAAIDVVLLIARGTGLG